MMLLEDNLLKLKWGGSFWHIIKKDILFQISSEEKKQVGSIKHFKMISPKNKPGFHFFPSEQMSWGGKKKKSHLEMLIMPFEEIC